MQRIIRLWSNLRISSKIALVSALCSAAGLLILTTVMVHIMTDHMLEQGKAELQMRVDQLVDLATLEHDMLEQGSGLQPFGHARHADGNLGAVQIGCARRGSHQERRDHVHVRHLW